MSILQRYFASEIVRAVLFVLAVFLALFAFFDLINELRYVGQGNYHWQHAFFFVLMSMPAYAYELMPIAVLIGGIYAMAQFASNSEFTIMRASSMSTVKACRMLANIALMFVVATMLIGEFFAPAATKMAEAMRMSAQGASVRKDFRTGMWSKDTIRENGQSGKVIGSRFINIGELLPDGTLRRVKLFEFDTELRLTAIVSADSAVYQGDNVWRMDRVGETVLRRGTKAAVHGMASNIVSRKMDSRDLVTDITPNLLSVLFAKPDKMSAYDLAVYKGHLADNNQDTAVYEIAFWKKLVYPFSVFVMMALALPFAYLHFRSGGISLKIFAGIMIGVSFMLINSLFSHVGLLNTWPPFITAVIPSGLFLLSAIGALWWVERH
ncbi:MAG: putative permease YjgP/YjgQ family protein [Burkholderiaceae bacterium]|nr:putative permease YjgP/YjgQ family protein [Burkholderiaceae bacterium]